MTGQVIVVGAGIVGSALAYQLARAGADVTLVDPRPGTGASEGNAGLLVPSYSRPMAHPAMLAEGVRGLLGRGQDITLRFPVTAATAGWLGRFALASRPGRSWRAASRIAALAHRSRWWYEQFAHEENVHFGLSAAGTLAVSRNAKALRNHYRSAVRLAQSGVTAELLDAAAVAELEPHLAGLAGAVRFPGDALLDPARTTEAVRQAAERHGARLHRARVESIRADGVRGVHTDAGPLAADVVVIAAGADSPALARTAGARLAVEAGRGWSVTVPCEPVLHHAVVDLDHHVVLGQRGRLLRLTGGMELGGRPPAEPDTQGLRRAASRLLPHADLGADGTVWQGARPMTPDGLPITRRLRPGLYAATGHGQLGMTLAPATAETTAAAILRDLISRRARA
ncbi:NAD(P)/FAD-dependent oxidoreductase [Amycolatopsis granulosa]|uniref:NAD(P)/FAD-dependent oxidoreductase n=1 Tax=Amycolatopsis granulosa TaxID=185684 RepID=UPI0014210EF5|nr:FAD-dependent oxidoreductase [Amycolatopsis granulosa]NIH83837.1 D-amino-acid dehydrogenase [Amycolatopsis granulosa]